MSVRKVYECNQSDFELYTGNYNTDSCYIEITDGCMYFSVCLNSDDLIELISDLQYIKKQIDNNIENNQ